MRTSSGSDGSAAGGGEGPGLRAIRSLTSVQRLRDEDRPVLDVEGHVLPLLLEDALEVDEALGAIRDERVRDLTRLPDAGELHLLRDRIALDPRADPAAPGHALRVGHLRTLEARDRVEHLSWRRHDAEVSAEAARVLVRHLGGTRAEPEAVREGGADNLGQMDELDPRELVLLLERRVALRAGEHDLLDAALRERPLVPGTQLLEGSRLPDPQEVVPAARLRLQDPGLDPEVVQHVDRGLRDLDMASAEMSEHRVQVRTAPEEQRDLPVLGHLG